jgi:glutathione peroxidase
MFHKIDVNGDTACELYQWLRTEQPGLGATNDVTWNFEKFLVDRNGAVVARFAPPFTPDEIAAALPQYL